MKTPSTTSQTLRIYWQYTRRYLPEFLIGSVGAVLATIAQSMVPPYIIAQLFKKLQFAYQHHQTLQFHAFLPYFVAFAISMLCGLILWRIQGYAVWRLESKVFRDLANDIYDHLQ